MATSSNSTRGKIDADFAFLHLEDMGHDAGAGKRGDQFSNSNTVRTADEKTIADLIARRSRRLPITTKELQTATGLTERAVMAIIEDLRVIHRLRIGASRQYPVGYYPIVSDEDEINAIAPLLKQVQCVGSA